jgi:cytosine/creatinine deaminase
MANTGRANFDQWTYHWPACVGTLRSLHLPATIDLLRHARLADGELVDLRMDDGLVVEVAAAGSLTATDPGATLELDGWLLLCAPAEPHAHLDKALTFDLIEPPLGDLNSAVAAWVAYAATTTVESIVDRARTQVRNMLANGITAIRSHADVHPGFPTRSAEGLVSLRTELEGLVDLEIVALASRHASPADIDAALDVGLDLVGGAPHLADDPGAEVDRLVEIATRHELGVDLHVDENLDGPLTLGHYARLVRDLPRDRQYSASHCVRLGTLEPQPLAEIIAEVVAADVGVISLPITNLYLQGWQHPALTPRGLTALRALLSAGVRVGAGADNVQDPFNPVGRSDAFETASLLVTAGHLTPNEAWTLVSTGARSVMGLPAAGPHVGGRAELLAVRARSLTEAIATAPADRLVIHEGRLVAQSELRRSVATGVLTTIGRGL